MRWGQARRALARCSRLSRAASSPGAPARGWSGPVLQAGSEQGGAAAHVAGNGGDQRRRAGGQDPAQRQQAAPRREEGRVAIEGLLIADFACGTGALLSAAQRAVYRRYRRAGGDDKGLHQALMEHVLTGLDIMPAATHLTCSMLSSSHPSLAYGESQIHTMPYGIDGGTTHIGALDLLESEHSMSLFATGQSIAGSEAHLSTQHSVTIKDESCDPVIMNPPFTRPTNHKGAARANTPVPSFAGFRKSHEEQKAMSKKLRRCQPEFGHGSAGLASNFMDLGHRKLKDGGVLALVMPFTFARGNSWVKAEEGVGGPLQRHPHPVNCDDGIEGKSVFSGHRHGRMPCRGHPAGAVRVVCRILQSPSPTCIPA